MAKKIKKLLTLEQLVQFCEQNKFYAFSAKDQGYTLSVQVPGNLSFSDEADDDLLFTTVKVCHTLLNRNGSYISEKNMKRAMPSLKYKPLLASIIADEETNELDFNGHDMVINEDGSVDYIERQIGTFTVDEPYLEYDKKQDKTYVMATAVIPREYTKAAEIIERKNGTKVSCELKINEMTYNVTERYLELTDFVFSGVCCLGESVGEGMLGSRLDITDFSTENNSLRFEENNQLIAVLEKLNDTLSELNINSETLKEGGNESVNKFEELLAKYGKTVEDVTFEYENLTDEELEEKFAAEFGEENTDGEGEPEPTSEGDEGNDGAEPDEPSDAEEGEQPTEDFAEGEEHETPVDTNSITYSVNDKTFAISLDDIQFALNSLVNDTYSEQDGCYYATTVYEDHLVMIDYWTGKAYKQSYKKRKDSYSLTGDRVPVKSCWLTAEEEQAIDNMRSNYAAIETQLKEYQAKEETAQKNALFVSEDYASIADKDEFKELAENHAEFSVDELKSKLDEIILSYAKKGGLAFTATSKPEVPGLNFVSSLTSNKPEKNSFLDGLLKNTK